MPNTVVFLWISAGVSAAASASPSAAAPGTARAFSALEDYGAARGLEFSPVSAAIAPRPQGSQAEDAALVDGIEAELEQARTALSALEEVPAVARLARVQSLLLSHPHLPQASFLMGECLALQARATREQSPLLSESLELRRAALEGPRATAFGESAPADTAQTRLSLDVQGLSSVDDLELDGTARGHARHVELAAGLHHVRVWRRQRLVFSSFTEVVPEQRALTVAVPPLEPCSAEDISDPDNVACARWAKVRVEPGGVGVALCEFSRCGDFVHWQKREAAPFAPIPPERRGLPTWAGFLIAGVTLTAATTVVIWQAGAFDRKPSRSATWEYGGLDPQPQGLRF